MCECTGSCVKHVMTSLNVVLMVLCFNMLVLGGLVCDRDLVREIHESQADFTGREEYAETAGLGLVGLGIIGVFFPLGGIWAIRHR